jgi:hypothetical protein
MQVIAALTEKITEHSFNLSNPAQQTTLGTHSKLQSMQRTSAGRLDAGNFDETSKKVPIHFEPGLLMTVIRPRSLSWTGATFSNNHVDEIR